MHLYCAAFGVSERALIKNGGVVMKKSLFALIAVILSLSLTLVACGNSTLSSSSEAKKSTGNSSSLSSSSVATVSADDEMAEFVAKYLEGKGLKDDGTPYKVGLCFADLITEYVINLSEYLKLMLTQAGCEIVTAQSEMDVRVEDAAIDDFISNKCDVVVIHAVDSAGSSAAIKRLNDANIPVICIIRTVENVEYEMYVSTSDNVQTGRKAMQYLADAADGKEVEIATVQGYMGASDAYLREEGYVGVIGENANMKYVSENPCEWDQQSAEAAISDALVAHPNLWGIASHSDGMAPGVYSALRQANKTAKVGEEGHIFWASIDGAPYALNLIRESVMDCTIEQSPLTASTITAKAILDYILKGIPMGGIAADVPTSIITSENVDEPGLWGNYSIESKSLWSRTEEIWNSSLNL